MSLKTMIIKLIQYHNWLDIRNVDDTTNRHVNCLMKQTINSLSPMGNLILQLSAKIGSPTDVYNFDSKPYLLPSKITFELLLLKVQSA